MVRVRLVILGIAAILVAIRCLLPAGVFWISDAGNKFLVAQNFIATNFTSVAIAYPAADLDPAFRWFPTAGEHFVRSNGQFFSIVSFVFPLVNAPLIGWFGAAGATLLPLLAAFGILLLVPRLIRAAGAPVHAGVAVAAVAFATPLGFYALDFWEHTTATFFATLALLLFIEQRPFAAGLALGVSIAFREEGYVLLLAICAASLARELRPRLPRLLAGTAVLVVPLLVAQQMIYGNPLGLHLAAHTGSDGIPLPVRLARNAYYFLLQFHASPWIALLLAIPAVAAVIAGAFRVGERMRLVVTTAMLVASGAGVAMLLVHRDPIANTAATQGLLLAVPLLAPFVVRWRDAASGTDAIGLLARVVVLYIVLMPLVLRANWSGLIWGPRYFLTIIPVAVVLALAYVERRTLAAALLAVSFVLQLDGLVLLHRKLEAGAEVLTALRRTPPVILTDVFWLPEEMSALYFEKKILMPANGRELGAAARTLAERGVNDVAVVSSPAFRWYSDRTRRSIAQGATRHTRIEPAGVPLFTLDVHELRLTR